MDETFFPFFCLLKTDFIRFSPSMGKNDLYNKTPAMSREPLWAVLNLSRTTSFPKNR